MFNSYLSRFAGETGMVAPHARNSFVSRLVNLERALPSIEASMREQITKAEMRDDFWPAEGSWMAQFRPYKVKDGVLSIPVKGVLLHDFGFQVFDWATGYQYIQRAVERGIADPAVKGIAFDINSPGGEVSGCFDLTDKIFEARSVKPIHAFAAEHAYSAAYAVASAASKLSVARTGGVGSIGVVTMHVDYSERLEKDGISVTFIHAGKHKVDGNAYEPLPADVKARIQERIDATYAVFVASVARNRGMDEKAVRATEALTFSAEEAVSNGLADAIASIDDGLAAFAADLNKKQGVTIMSKEQDKANVDQTVIDAAKNEGHSAGVAEGRKQERDRVAAIMALDEAKDRRETAFNIALTTDLTVEQAKGVLATVPVAAAPQAAAPKGNTAFEKAMANGNPEIESGAAAPQDKVQQILGDYARAGGAGVKKA